MHVLHMSTHTSTCHTHVHSHTIPHQHVTHNKYTHTHTHTGAPIDNENEKIMEEEKKLNASEWQVAKLYLDYQDTGTACIQFKDDRGTYIHHQLNSSLYNQVDV